MALARQPVPHHTQARLLVFALLFACILGLALFALAQFITPESRRTEVRLPAGLQPQLVTDGGVEAWVVRHADGSVTAVSATVDHPARYRVQFVEPGAVPDGYKECLPNGYFSPLPGDYIALDGRSVYGPYRLSRYPVEVRGDLALIDLDHPMKQQSHFAC